MGTQRLIVRDGERLPEGNGIPPHAGEGIALDEQGHVVADVSGVGYMEFDEHGKARVVSCIAINEDRTRANLDLRAPAVDEEPITRSEVETAIRDTGIGPNLVQDSFDRSWLEFEQHGSLEAPHCIARGTAPVPGVDAHLELKVVDEASVGQVGDLGSVNYREQHSIQNVEAQQLIGIWHPASQGVAGRSVDGAELPATEGAAGTYTVREGVLTRELKDGKVALESELDGMLQISPSNELAVVKLIEVRKDVDLSTGNIDASGGVIVHGSVRTGFRVTAEHDIVIDGAVESATVVAGRTLTVKKGIIGQAEESVSATELVTLKYAQNAFITCVGDVVIGDTETNSVIECGGQLLATERRGLMRGGRYTAAGGVIARTIGSAMGVETLVSIGASPFMERQLQVVCEEIEEFESKKSALDRAIELARTKALGGDSKAAATLRQLLRTKLDLVRDGARLPARKAQIEQRLAPSVAPTIDIIEQVYPSVTIRIKGVELSVEESRRGIRFLWDPTSQSIVSESL